MGSFDHAYCAANSDGDTVYIGMTEDAEGLDIQDNHAADSEENVDSRLDTTAVAAVAE